MPVKLNSTGGGSVTVAAPNTASNYTATFPAADGNVVIADTSGTATVTNLYTTNLYASGTVQMGSSFLRNRIINGGMQIAQRGTTYNFTTSVAYGSIDRFFAGQNTSANGRFVQLAYNANGFQYIALLGRTTSATSTGVVFCGQTIETANCIDLQGKQVTLSFYVYAGANFSAASSLINVYVLSGTTADQGSAAMVAGTWAGFAVVVGSSQAITTNLTRYSFTGTVPSNSQELGFYISYTPVGTAGADDNIYFTGVQLEVGSVATPFERRLYGQELALCQRYYYKFTPAASASNTIGTGFADSTTSMQLFHFFPCVLRTNPTAISTSGTASDYAIRYTGGVTAVCNAVPQFSDANTTNATFNMTLSSAGPAAGTCVAGRAVNTNAILAWSAEL